MCQFCGCDDYFDLDEDLHELAEYDVHMAYNEQADRDEAELRAMREEANDHEDHSNAPYRDWGEQARVHEHIEHYNHDND
jgi:hypothetical protein